MQICPPIQFREMNYLSKNTIEYHRIPLLLKTVGAENSGDPQLANHPIFFAGRVSDYQTAPIQPTTLTWCTEPLGDNRYFAVTDDGVVTRSGESGEPLDVTGMILGIGGVIPKWPNDNSDYQGTVVN